MSRQVPGKGSGRFIAAWQVEAELLAQVAAGQVAAGQHRGSTKDRGRADRALAPNSLRPH